MRWLYANKAMVIPECNISKIIFEPSRCVVVLNNGTSIYSKTIELGEFEAMTVKAERDLSASNKESEDTGGNQGQVTT